MCILLKKCITGSAFLLRRLHFGRSVSKIGCSKVPSGKGPVLLSRSINLVIRIRVADGFVERLYPSFKQIFNPNSEKKGAAYTQVFTVIVRSTCHLVLTFVLEL